jgi:hypothetical protein
MKTNETGGASAQQYTRGARADIRKRNLDYNKPLNVIGCYDDLKKLE